MNRVITFLAILLTVGGCMTVQDTQTSQTEASAVPSRQFPLDAALLITEEERNYIFEGGPTTFVSSAWNLRQDAGQSLESTAKKTLTKVFPALRVIRGPNEAGPETLVIRPKLEKFTWQGGMSSLGSTIDIALSVAFGNETLLERKYSREVRSTATNIGMDYVSPAVRDASEKAMTGIFETSLSDLIGRPNVVTKLDSALPSQWAAAGRATQLPAPAASQAAPPRPRLPTTPLALDFPRGPPRPDDIAVVIGNADYSRQGRDIPDVMPAYADAASFKRYATQALGIRSGNIIDLRDATGAQLERVFGSERTHKGQLFDWVRPGQSRVWVYYAGHGAPAGKEGTAYLVPADADGTRIEINGYPLSLLYANLEKVPAKSVTVVLEACFSGASPAGSVIGKASPIFLKAKEASVPEGVTVIAAGAPEQMASWEQDESHGLFTKYYLTAMSGAADKSPHGNGDGTVDFGELKTYLQHTLTYYARRYYGRDQTARIVVGGR